MKNIFQRLIPIFLLATLSACQQMGTSEYGVVFRKLPPQLGGGVSRNIVEPGQTTFVMPWESVYRIDTAVRNIEWGIKEDDEGATEDYVHTRAKDGNEVALAVRIQYRVLGNPESIVRLVQEVADSDEAVENLVSVIGRADIRTAMSQLNTAEFFQNEKKYEGANRVKDLMDKRLRDYGIEIQNVNLKEHRFERVLPSGAIDKSYQDKINEVQAITEQTKREELRKDTIIAQKKREFNDTQGEYDRMIAEANGYRQQAEYRGQGYYDTKKNEAEGIKVAGELAVKGMIEQINALQGPGGEAILKLELAKQLINSNAQFVLLGGGNSQALSVKRIDENTLLNQLGILEGMREPQDQRKQNERNESFKGE